ncbi:hypothetical protein [Pelagibacterium xiamenense]|uniref:hypothetical protein n=1 Tax=Pelagibacterium xiamenense TaxID=2901140 RepID=UPI001E28829F|nr:hypothetical protein [Pelagibacterium xiamenense]MCD7061407.1 hypothetical protein [Pelagibacterium xiamenense]
MSPAALIVGNGPSSKRWSLNKIEDRFGPIGSISRMNHFYITDAFGTEVDDLFFSVTDESLIANIYHCIDGKKFTVKNINTPIAPHNLGAITFLNNINIRNFWKDLVIDEFFASIYMRGSTVKLPTTGLQALHHRLVAGEREFVVTGIDFYTGDIRYADQAAMEELDLGHSNLTGYEIGAHSLQDDLNYLLHLSRAYEFSVKVLCAPPAWRQFGDMLARFGITSVHIDIVEGEDAT